MGKAKQHLMPQLEAAIREVVAPVAAYARSCGMNERGFLTLVGSAFRLGRASAELGGPALPYDLAMRIIGRWLTDPRYQRRGRPRPLAVQGKASFASLVRSARAGRSDLVLAALHRAGAVRVERGRVRLLQLGYVPARDAAAKVEFLGRAGGEFLKLIIHNLSVPAGETFLQRTASYDNIGASSLTMLRKRLRREGEQVLLRANALLAARDRDRRAGAGGGRRMRVSFGVYCFEEPVKSAKTGKAR